MNRSFELEKAHNSQGDFILLMLIVLLLGCGLASLFSASYFYAGKYYEDSFVFIKKQLIIGSIGVLFTFFAYKLTVDLVRKFTPYFLLLVFVLIILTFIPGIGREVMGGRRWLNVFGFSFQPSELSKLAIVLYLSNIFDKKHDRMNDLLNTVIPSFVVLGMLFALVLLQNDFSSAIFILSVGLLMFFMAGVHFLHFLYVMLMVIPLSAIFLFTKPHRVERLIAFLDPELDPVGSGYQVMAAKEALQNGGFWGLGIGNGSKKLGGLPEVYSDFIFASTAEEVGFFGVLCILLIFLGFSVRGFTHAYRSKTKYDFLLCTGLTSSILYQVFFNLAVVSGLVPATGIPLPFFSHGGSSLITTLLMCGFLLSATKRQYEVVL